MRFGEPSIAPTRHQGSAGFFQTETVARRPSDINEVIDNAIQLTRHELTRRNIEIVRNRNDPIPPIYADPDRLVQVFINLLSNAAQAIGRDGSIEVVTRSICVSERDLERAETSVFRIGEPVITVDIRDNGPGFPAEHEKSCLSPFLPPSRWAKALGLALLFRATSLSCTRDPLTFPTVPKGVVGALDVSGSSRALGQ